MLLGMPICLFVFVVGSGGSSGGKSRSGGGTHSRNATLEVFAVAGWLQGRRENLAFQRVVGGKSAGACAGSAGSAGSAGRREAYRGGAGVFEVLRVTLSRCLGSFCGECLTCFALHNSSLAFGSRSGVLNVLCLPLGCLFVCSSYRSILSEVQCSPRGFGGMAGCAVAQKLFLQVPAQALGALGCDRSGCVQFNPLQVEAREWVGAPMRGAVRWAGRDVTVSRKQVVSLMWAPLDAVAELRTAAGFGNGGGPRLDCKQQQARCTIAGASASGGLGQQPVDLGLEAGGNGTGGHGGKEGGGGGGGGGDSGNGRSRDDGDGKQLGRSTGLLAGLLRGWDDRVKADPQFPFKLLTEEVIGVGACVLGDMASRPNFGLNELDFVFSTIVVGAILNFTLMYMLAPTALSGAAVSSRLPGVFASCPSGHMFEPGAFSLVDRAGTFLYKGAQFAVVGFLAGLAGTTLSNFLIDLRKKMDPNFAPQNDSPPTFLNAATWAAHMGVSSNLRYQAVNGLEFALAGFMNPSVFKTSVFIIRGLNNVLGGTSFVTLARLTGSQKAGSEQGTAPADVVENVGKNVEAAGTS